MEYAVIVLFGVVGCLELFGYLGLFKSFLNQSEFDVSSWLALADANPK